VCVCVCMCGGAGNIKLASGHDELYSWTRFAGHGCATAVREYYVIGRLLYTRAQV